LTERLRITIFNSMRAMIASTVYYYRTARAGPI